MANKVLLKKSSVGARVPLVGDLDYGELALNYADGKLYYKTSGNTIDLYPSATATATLTNKTLTSPTLTTPSLGVATATSINKVAFTAPATGSTLTIADGKTLTASNSLTFTGTDATSFAFPGTSGTVVTLAATQTLTNKTLTLPVIDNIKQGYSTTATAAGTTILTSSSNGVQFFTGTTTQVLSLPAPQTMTLGMEFLIVNNSTGSVEVRAANSATVATVLPGTVVSCISIDLTAGNGAAGWNAEFVGFSSVTGTGANVLATSPAITTSVTTPSATFDLVNTTATTVNAFGAATTLNLGAATGTTTVSNRLKLSRTNSTATGTGQILLDGSNGNRIDWNTEGVAAPAFTTRSVGTKLTLYPTLSASQADYAIGINSGTLWNSIPGNDAGQFFKWYGGETQVASLSGTGNLTASGNITATGDVLGQYLRSTNSTGDEGGEILLYKPATNSTIAGTGVTIDVYQNKLRIFEQGGDARGVYIDMTAAGAGVSSSLLSGGSTVNSFQTIAVSGQSSVVADSSTDTLTLVAGTGITLTTDATADSITINSSGGSSGNSFETIAVSGQSSVVADSSTDTLTLAADGVIGIITNPSTDTITFTTNKSFPFTKYDGNASNIPLFTEASALATSLDTVYLPFAKSDGTSVTTLKLTA